MERLITKIITTIALGALMAIGVLINKVDRQAATIHRYEVLDSLKLVVNERR